MDETTTREGANCFAAQRSNTTAALTRDGMSWFPGPQSLGGSGCGVAPAALLLDLRPFRSLIAVNTRTGSERVTVPGIYVESEGGCPAITVSVDPAVLVREVSRGQAASSRANASRQRSLPDVLLLLLPRDAGRRAAFPAALRQFCLELGCGGAAPSAGSRARAAPRRSGPYR